MLVQKIQSDLFDFIGQDPDDQEGLIEFWYGANSNALSASLSSNDGLQIMINLSTFDLFEELSKKLFLVADSIVLRDARTYTPDDEQSSVLVPIIENYKPRFFDEVIGELKELRPSPLTISPHPRNKYWTSSEKKLNNGYDARYASQMGSNIPKAFIDWILSNSGRRYLETGSIIYAPFIPPLDVELEFLKNNVSLPQHFNVLPCFHQNHSWLNDDSLYALFSLKFPFLDNIDIETISKVKEDHHDEFENFSKSLTEAISSINSSYGTEGFLKEVKYIQDHQIDSGLSDIEKTMKRISSFSSLRKLGVLTGLLGVNASIFLGASAPIIASGIAAGGAGFIMDKIVDMKDKGELKDKAPYFLWKLAQAAKP